MKDHKCYLDPHTDYVSLRKDEEMNIGADVAVRDGIAIKWIRASECALLLDGNFSTI